MDRPGARREPRSMTLVDLVSLVAGVALGYAAITSQPGGAFIPAAWVLVVLAASNLSLWTTIALSVVALGRMAAYGRMPRPAEWLAIVVSATAQAGRPEFNVDGRVNDLFAAFPLWKERLDFDGWRWVVAGLASAAILATFGVLRLGRRAFPAWLKALLLAWAALLAMAGPLWTFGFLGDDLVSPSTGFGAGDLAILHRQACVLFGDFPTGLFFGVAMMGAWLDRSAGRRWAWGEWAAATTSPVVGLAPLLFFLGDLATIPGPWPAELALILAWFLAVAQASRLIVARLGPPWRRWIEGPTDQDRSPPSGSDSPSRIR